MTAVTWTLSQFSPRVAPLSSPTWLISCLSSLIALSTHAAPEVALKHRDPEIVIVTASQNPEDGSTLPLSWSSIGSEALTLVAPVHINEVVHRVPGAWISRGNGQESLIALRSPVLTGAGACGAFATAADGIALRAPGFCNVNQLFEANTEQAGRIEVLRGPATALYGSNAMHGVINILSTAPTLKLDHALALEVGPNDYYRTKYYYRDTQGKHGISFNANGVTDGGFLDDAGYDQQKITLRHDYEGEIWRSRTVLDGSNLNQETAGFIQGQKAFKDSAIRRSNPNPESYRDAQSLRFHSRLSAAINPSTQLQLTPYLRYADMEFLQHFLPWQPTESNRQKSLGLRLAMHTTVDNSQWILGIDGEVTDARLKENQARPFSDNQPAGTHYDYRVDARSIAAYAQMRTLWSSPWELSAGLRIEHNRYDYDNRTGDGAACSAAASACRFFRPADREDEFTDWSLNGGVSYPLGDNQLVYLRLARGFRAPQATELYRLQSAQQTEVLDSEEIDNVELGVRGTWASRVNYELTLYHMRKREVIFQDADRRNINGAKTKHQGLELSLDIDLATNLSLGIDANLARHRYDSAVVLLGGISDIKGNDIDTAPRSFGSARLRWDTSILTGRASVAELEWIYMDSYFLEPRNEHRYDGHSLLNLRLASQLNRRWHAALRVTNLLDREYAERADFGFGNYRYFVGQDRGVYVQLRYQLGESSR